MDGYTGLALFGAPWCVPCKAAKAALQGVEYRYVDVDADPEAGVRYGIVGVPALLAIKDGREVARASAVSKASAADLMRLVA